MRHLISPPFMPFKNFKGSLPNLQITGRRLRISGCSVVSQGLGFRI